ncbi:protein SCO1/2 [Roseiarcus fermentans]|uniref:Protein SCO1/2 n=1 Tax=Roseiarcus fermentans TaxID=1473586 RepID=A0A366F9B4_9HYPH|nr:SCO family protein [Roseiarcus fermentans]RBP10550.1 protein SCO1/2 [Roseiarcus fermentans]
MTRSRALKVMQAFAAVAALALGAAAAGPGGWPGSSLYNLESRWTDQDGGSVALDAFAGAPVVVAMGYTTCRDICPAIVADMMWVERHLPPGATSRVRFAFFSFDSEADTPERLKLYAESHGLDPRRWTLLRADDSAARELAAALDVPWRPNDRNGFDHAAVLTLLDGKGEIAFQQRGTQASSDELLGRLKGLIAKGE